MNNDKQIRENVYIYIYNRIYEGECHYLASKWMGQ